MMNGIVLREDGNDLRLGMVLYKEERYKNKKCEMVKFRHDETGNKMFLNCSLGAHHRAYNHYGAQSIGHQWIEE